MLISRLKGWRAGAAGALVMAGLAIAPSVHAAADGMSFTSPETALRQGISAYNGGYPEIALPALEHAASKDLFLGTYYLAKLYADSSIAHTDHEKAYVLFRRIANENADVDPDYDARAPYVAGALVALAKYIRTGLPGLNIQANPRKAAKYLRYAASFFNDEDAQFELAKMQLNGDGVRADVASGRHWLAKLARRNGHAGAQAFLADLYWRGKYTRQDPVQALTLISVAVKNARPGDRVWIEDIYQSIYCGASEGVRRQATGMVAEWDNRYGDRRALPGRSNLGVLDNTSARRTCADGRAVPLDFDAPMPAGPDTGLLVEAERPGADEPVGFMRGDAGRGTGFRPAGVRR